MFRRSEVKSFDTNWHEFTQKERTFLDVKSFKNISQSTQRKNVFRCIRALKTFHEAHKERTFLDVKSFKNISRSSQRKNKEYHF